MKTSYRLLQKYLSFNLPPSELADKLTKQGLEVENMEKYGTKIEGVIIGEIIEKAKHPDADKLTVCKVNTGNTILTIVCGAQNHQEKDKVAIATIGTELPNGLKIKKAKIRGVESEGMICSKAELGIEKESDGVWILPPNSPIGEKITSLLPQEDTLFTIAITANRSDCLSNIGIARECGIITNKNITYPTFKINENPSVKKPDITILEPSLCRRYASRIIEGVSIQESPDWLKEALIKYGARPINNIVDITNYVMFELGQPLHAFDYQKLKDGKIIVRKAKPQETIPALDGKEYPLDPEMLIIADAEKPVAIAGVMGGANSEVDEKTTTVLMESAYFHPSSIRKTSKKLGLKSESSYRFERDVNPDGTVTALDMAVSLILELAGGKASSLTDNYPEPFTPIQVFVRKTFIDKMLGFSIPASEIERLLQLLEFRFKKKGEDYEITIPLFRRDCSREIDIVEEIIRTYGYEKLPETFRPAPLNIDNFDTTENWDFLIKNFFVQKGLYECYNLSFTQSQKNNYYSNETIIIKNPLSSEYDALRVSLLESLLHNLKWNREKGNKRVFIFEIGKIFKQNQNNFEERKKLGILLSGSLSDSNWLEKPSNVDFYYLKGLLEEFFSVMAKQEMDCEKITVPFLHPGKSASIKIKNQQIGFFGEIHPDINDSYDFKEPIVYAEIDLEQFISFPKPNKTYQKISKFQAVERDLAFVMDKKSDAGIIFKILKEFPLVRTVKISDVYTGAPIPEDKKSVVYTFILQSDDHTLTDEEIHDVMEQMIEKAKKTGANLR